MHPATSPNKSLWWPCFGMATTIPRPQPNRNDLERSITSSKEKKRLSKIPQRFTDCHSGRMEKNSKWTNLKTIRNDARSIEGNKKDERLCHKVLKTRISNSVIV